jgi:predicted Zn-dependent protease with MMP-like domain/Flp pilus assembly protein TadD
MADVEAMCDEAAEALEDDRPEEALALARQARQAAPNALDPVLLETDALVLLGRAEEALDLLDEAIEKHPEDPSLLLAAAGIVVDTSDDHAALTEAIDRLMRAEKLTKKAKEQELVGQVLWTRGAAHAALAELGEAADAYQAAYRILGDEPELLVELASSLFEVLRFEEAERFLRRALVDLPDRASVHHHLGLVAERQGREREAEQHFARARELDPESYPAPLKLSEDDFAAVVESALEKIPREVREKLANVAVMIEALPPLPLLRGDPPLSPLSLELFQGPSVGEDAGSQLPPSILLFQRNLERYARTREELEEEIETTVLHEVGHFVGWDEDDLYERGLD